jgi:hypothetical protein
VTPLLQLAWMQERHPLVVAPASPIEASGTIRLARFASTAHASGAASMVPVSAAASAAAASVWSVVTSAVPESSGEPPLVEPPQPDATAAMIADVVASPRSH